MPQGSHCRFLSFQCIELGALSGVFVLHEPGKDSPSSPGKMDMPASWGTSPPWGACQTTRCVGTGDKRHSGKLRCRPPTTRPAAWFSQVQDQHQEGIPDQKEEEKEGGMGRGGVENSRGESGRASYPRWSPSSTRIVQGRRPRGTPRGRGLGGFTAT